MFEHLWATLAADGRFAAQRKYIFLWMNKRKLKSQRIVIPATNT
jgi:hypothetical protein